MAGKTSSATAPEILRFWTEIMRDESGELKDRLKVSELLAKALGAFGDEAAKPAADNPLSGMTLEEKFALIEKIRKGD